MSYNKYYSPTTWEDFPSENTAIDAQRLNHLEDGVDELDDRICALDVNKTQVSWNQQLLTGDKIAEISINGVVKNVYAPNVDGASQQAQAAALVSEGHAQGTQGGSAVSPGSQYYHNNAKYYAEQASASFDNKIASEGYALGTENGDPVPSGSIYYHNNAKFYAEEARHFTPEGYQELVDEVEEKIDKSDVDVKSVTTGKFDTITGGLMQSCVVDLEPIQSGSGVPSPSNVRAISGHTQVQVENRGKNKLNVDDVEIGVAWNGVSNSARARLIIPCKPSKTYILSMNGTNGLDGVYYESSASIPPSGISGVTFPQQITTRSTDKYITLGFNKANISKTDIEALKLQLEEGSTATEYTPYNGYTVTINLGGTYYGGTLDAVSGKFTVTHGIVDLSTLTWAYRSEIGQGIFGSGSLANYKYSNDVDALCSAYNFIGTIQAGGNITSYNSGSIALLVNTSQSKYLVAKNTAYSDVTAFTNSLSGVMLCYELATPQTIQLDPQTLETLIGQNDVFAPLVGQSVDKVDYKKLFTWNDVKTYVDSKIS